jgi:hypothetical protein
MNLGKYARYGIVTLCGLLLFFLGSSLPFQTNLMALVSLFATAIAGLIMTAIIVDIRFECILYAKTVNLARRFFMDKGEEYKLQSYRLLPDGDDFPKYYEQPWEIVNRRWKWELGVGSTFLQVSLMGLLNATYFSLVVMNFARACDMFCVDQELLFGVISWFSFLALHILGYRYFANKKDAQWEAKKSSTGRPTTC